MYPEVLLVVGKSPLFLMGLSERLLLSLGLDMPMDEGHGAGHDDAGDSYISHLSHDAASGYALLPTNKPRGSVPHLAEHVLAAERNISNNDHPTGDHNNNQRKISDCRRGG